MTRYWPWSVIVESPLMPAQCVWELKDILKRSPSRMAYQAVFSVARETTPIDGRLVVIETTGAPNVRAYADYPEFDEWIRLERCGMIQASDGMFAIFIDVLH
jgi:hypothetical protein